MQADSALIESCPEDSYRTVWARWKQVSFVAAFPCLQHTLIPSERWGSDHILNDPVASVNELFLSRRYRKRSKDLLFFPYGYKLLIRIHDD